MRRIQKVLQDDYKTECDLHLILQHNVSTMFNAFVALISQTVFALLSVFPNRLPSQPCAIHHLHKGPHEDFRF